MVLGCVGEVGGTPKSNNFSFVMCIIDWSMTKNKLKNQKPLDKSQNRYIYIYIYSVVSPRVWGCLSKVQE